MGTITGTQIATGVSEQVQDKDKVAYSDADILRWLNESQLSVCVIRPDANSEYTNMLLTPGDTRQEHPTAKQVLSVVRNKGSAGTTNGRGIKLADLKTINEVDPDWHTATASTTIREFAQDDRQLTSFFVSPPPHAVTPVYVEVLIATNPTPLAALTSVITLDDVYSPAMTEWILFRLFGRDSDMSPNAQRSAMHLQNFVSMLGGKTSVDVAFKPKS